MHSWPPLSLSFVNALDKTEKTSDQNEVQTRKLRVFVTANQMDSKTVNSFILMTALVARL